MKLRFLIITLSSLALFSCEKEAPTPQMTLSEVTPTYGVPGTIITLKGDHFNVDGSLQVFVNDLEIIPESVGKNEIKLLLPEEAQTGFISVQNNDLILNSDTEFEVLKDIPRDGLVAFLPLNASVQDHGMHELPVITNGTNTTTDRFGNQDYALAFDGVDDYLNMENPVELQLSTNITLSAWVYVPDLELKPCIFSKYSEAGAGYYFRFGPRANEQPAGLSMICSPSNGMNYTWGTFEPSTSWRHLTVTLSEGIIGYFLDGSLIAQYLEGQSSLQNATNSNFLIGSMNQGFFFKGKMDDIAIYNRALTEAEVLQLYEQTLTSK